MTLTLVSVGLSSHLDLSLRALEAARGAHHVYVEAYTMRLDTTVEAAVQVAERIRSAIEGRRFEIGQGQSLGITVSLGVASLPAQETSVEKLVAAADKALYEAKEKGRNRVVMG